ncbi:MAG: glycosyltransferase family 2 protein [Candidatus Portnoybacteria bacterium]|nr:glycosyltransferase family 2 protein [Candidatus Portnoybacteria bacterium]
MISINIITFNGERYIKKCLESVAHQTYKNIEVNILDNNSQDNTVKVLEKTLKSLKLKAISYFERSEKQSSIRRIGLYKLKANLGFAKGHNMLIEKSRGEYILMLNQDAWLDKWYIANALDIFKKDDKIAALQPKIYRYDFEKNAIVKKESKPIIDATGLVVLKNRRVIAQGQGQPDEGQFENPPSSASWRTTEGVRFSKDSALPRQENLTEVFGADGAAPIFRRTALDDIKIPIFHHTKYKIPNTKYEYFDQDFFMYKEDVDLSWRLRLYGWKILYSPGLIAYHERGSGESAATNYLDIIKERRHVSQCAKALSWRNQRLMQVKNELPGIYFRHFPCIFAKELASFFYILFFEHFALRSIKEFFILLPACMKKREIIMAHRKVSAREMRKWFQ